MCMHDSPSSQQDSISEDDIYSTPDEPMSSGDVPPLPPRVCRVLCNDCHHYPQYPVTTTPSTLSPLPTRAYCISYPVSTPLGNVVYHTLSPLTPRHVVYHTQSPLSSGHVAYCIIPCIHTPRECCVLYSISTIPRVRCVLYRTLYPQVMYRFIYIKNSAAAVVRTTQNIRIEFLI